MNMFASKGFLVFSECHLRNLCENESKTKMSTFDVSVAEICNSLFVYVMPENSRFFFTVIIFMQMSLFLIVI